MEKKKSSKKPTPKKEIKTEKTTVKKRSHLDRISIPKYSLGEEIFNAVSHGLGAGLAIAALVLMIIKAHGGMAITSVTLFGSGMIVLYTMSCIYHALSHNLKGKKVLRVIDHCNVYALVFCTYIPMCLVAIGGALGWVIFGILLAVTAVGITLTAINVDKYVKLEVACHLINGWASLMILPRLLHNIGGWGVFFLILGGVMYSVGSILYGLGHKKKYTHSVFHIFCLLGTFFHFITIYFFVI